MSDLLMAPLAVTAGALSFTSPCALPLLPGYIAYISALPDGATAGRNVRVRAGALFVAGFSTVFTALGVVVGLTGATVAEHVAGVGRASGVVLIVTGAVTSGVVPTPSLLLRDHRPGLRRSRERPAGAFFLGAAFAAGWSPCLGPVLASILAVSARASTAGWGGTLLLLYSIGLGAPFLVLAASADRPRWVGALRRHSVALQRGGGFVLMAVGVLLVTDTWERLLQPLQRALVDLEWPPV